MLLKAKCECGGYIASAQRRATLNEHMKEHQAFQEQPELHRPEAAKQY